VRLQVLEISLLTRCQPAGPGVACAQNAAHVSEHGTVKTMAPHFCHLCCMGLTSSATQPSAQRHHADNLPSVLLYYAHLSWRVVDLQQKLLPPSCFTGIVLSHKSRSACLSFFATQRRCLRLINVSCRRLPWPSDAVGLCGVC
jgi:hypothetical protein